MALCARGGARKPPCGLPPPALHYEKQLWKTCPWFSIDAVIIVLLEQRSFNSLPSAKKLSACLPFFTKLRILNNSSYRFILDIKEAHVQIGFPFCDPTL